MNKKILLLLLLFLLFSCSAAESQESPPTNEEFIEDKTLYESRIHKVERVCIEGTVFLLFYDGRNVVPIQLKDVNSRVIECGGFR